MNKCFSNSNSKNSNWREFCILNGKMYNNHKLELAMNACTVWAQYIYSKGSMLKMWLWNRYGVPTLSFIWKYNAFAYLDYCYCYPQAQSLMANSLPWRKTHSNCFPQFLHVEGSIPGIVSPQMNKAQNRFSEFPRSLLLWNI